jgi:hypothetical protein
MKLDTNNLNINYQFKTTGIYSQLNDGQIRAYLPHLLNSLRIHKR